MIVYNLTIKVTWDILNEWLAWQKTEQIPAVLATGLFDHHAFYRLLEQEEEEGPTFVLQYFTSSLERYEQYLIESAPRQRQAALDKWGGQFIAFRTIMETVETYR